MLYSEFFNPQNDNFHFIIHEVSAYIENSLSYPVYFLDPGIFLVETTVDKACSRDF